MSWGGSPRMWLFAGCCLLVAISMETAAWVLAMFMLGVVILAVGLLVLRLMFGRQKQ